MSDESAKWHTLYNQHRSLFVKAATQKLSQAQEAELKSVLTELGKLEPYLEYRVEFVDPRDIAANAAAAEFDAHYRRKAELDRKFFGQTP